MHTNPDDQRTEPADLGLYCPECEYNLTGASGERCPWCGEPIDIGVVIEQVGAGRAGGRRAVIYTCLLLALLSLVACTTVGLRSWGRLGVLDGVAMAGVVLAAIGYAALAGTAMLKRRFWPMRNGVAGPIVRRMAWIAIVCGVVGAASMLGVAPTPRVVRGVPVTGPFEFILAAVLLTLPGWLLLLMAAMSFRPRRALRTGDESDTAAAVDTAGEQAASRAPFQVDLVRECSHEQVHHRWTDEAVPTHPAVQAAVAHTWEAEWSLAGHEGRNLYDGNLARLVDAACDVDGELHLTLGPTSYRQFLGTNVQNLHQVLALGSQYLANPVGVSAVVVTADGYMVFGRRSRRVTVQAGFLHCIGGMLEVSDSSPVRVDAHLPPSCFAAMSRELSEELPLQTREIRPLRLIGIARDRSLLQPEIIFDAPITISRNELLTRFASHSAGGEHTGLETVAEEPEAMAAFITCSAPVSGIAQAAILLHGQCLWGMHWYEQICLRLYAEIPRARLRANHVS